MIRVDREPVFVLHRRPYRETSLLLEGFSLNHGRVGLICRGVRRRRGGDVHLFHLLDTSWRGRGDLYTMTRWEVVRSHRLSGAQVSICGLYLNELLLKLVNRGVPAPGLFRSYAQTLATLAAEGEVESALRAFEFELLRALGYGLQLEQDSAGRPLVSNGRYRFVGEQGLVYCGEDPTARDVVTGDALLALRDQRLEDQELVRQVRKLLAVALDHQLQGRELQTRKLLRYVGSHRRS